MSAKPLALPFLILSFIVILTYIVITTVSDGIHAKQQTSQNPIPNFPNSQNFVLVEPRVSRITFDQWQGKVRWFALEPISLSGDIKNFYLMGEDLEKMEFSVDSSKNPVSIAVPKDAAAYLMEGHSSTPNGYQLEHENGAR